MNAFMSSAVLSLTAVAFAVLAAFVAYRSRRNRSEDLGQVSSQWVTEHRSATGYDMSRWHRR